MRLWHQELLPKLPQKQLCGQWRECLALLGNGWGRKHSVVNYVFDNPYEFLIGYSKEVAKEMIKREYHPNLSLIEEKIRLHDFHISELSLTYPIYSEHDNNYLLDCLDNLFKKNIIIIMEEDK